MGAQPPTPEWGTMLAEGRLFLRVAGWMGACRARGDCRQVVTPPQAFVAATLQPGRGALRLFYMITTDISLGTLLDGANFARLTTFRKNGQPVPTTIWFALSDTAAYFVTGPDTGKAKRMRGTAQVRLGPSTPRGKPTGDETDCRARQLDEAEAGAARDLLVRKYGIQFRILQLIQFLRRARPVYFELSPAR